MGRLQHGSHYQRGTLREGSLRAGECAALRIEGSVGGDLRGSELAAEGTAAESFDEGGRVRGLQDRLERLISSGDLGDHPFSGTLEITPGVIVHHHDTLVV